MSAERRRKIAEMTSTVLGPLPMGVVLGLGVGVHSGRGIIAGASWGVLSVVCAAVLPALLTAPLRNRETRTARIRLAYMTPAVGGALTGLAVLTWLHAPRDVIVLAIGFAAGLIGSAVVNAVYRASNHAAALTGGVLLAAALLSPLAIFASPLIALLGWSRLATRAHTSREVAVGALVGAVAVLLTLALTA